MPTASPLAGRVHARTAVQPAHGRRHNLSLVLQTLFSRGAMSRADLARHLGLTKVTVSDLVADLLETEHAVELGPSEVVRPGKPATLVDVNRTGLQTVGLDLAAHEVLRGAVLDLDGNILARHEVPLGDVSGDEVLDQVLELTRTMVAAATATLLGIGVGTPGIVGPGGVVDTAPNLGWTDVPLRDLLADATGLPVFVCNDADAAVQADRTLGRGGDDMVLVKIGRGVGCGLIVGGQRVRGAHFAAGEIGHVTVGTDGGARCRCGKVGCLETWLSAPNLERALAADITRREGQDAADDLGGIPGVGGAGPEGQDAADDLGGIPGVDGAGAQGQDAADDVSGIPPVERGPLREAGERLGIALAPVVGALDLSEVVLSGPETLIGSDLLAALEQTLRARLLAGPTRDLRVRLADDSADIVLRGASVFVLWDRLGVA